jgi:hypothetical protein
VCEEVSVDPQGEDGSLGSAHRRRPPRGTSLRASRRLPPGSTRGPFWAALVPSRGWSVERRQVLRCLGHLLCGVARVLWRFIIAATATPHSRDREDAGTRALHSASWWANQRSGSCVAAFVALLSGCASGAKDDGSSDEAPDAGAAGVSAGDLGGDDPSSDASSAASSGLQASVTYPFLIPDPKGSVDYFPTVFAHLLGQPLAWPEVSTSLACFTLKNPTDRPWAATVRIDLLGYSTPLEQSVLVPANSTSSACVNPTPALSTL